MIGKTISHYKILEKLGEGGMGIVYKAEDIQLQRLVALKFLPPHVSKDSEEKARFIHEARSASALNHPNVTTIYGIEESSEGLFIAMECVEGKTLKQIVKEGPLSMKKVLDLGIQICEGLAVAHEKGVIHRDIKSENIMVTARGQVKIMDFGLAKLKGASKLTQAGTTLGTIGYMSPEQASGEEVDQRSDIFSAGVVLYELLTGRLPFQGENQAAIVNAIINEEPQPVARFNSQASAKLEDMVSKALAKDREERYQHIDDLLADLRRERKVLEYTRTAKYAEAAKAAEATRAVEPAKATEATRIAEATKAADTTRLADAGGPTRAEYELPTEAARKPGAYRSRKKILGIAIPVAVACAVVLVIFILEPFRVEMGPRKEAVAKENSLAIMYFENLVDRDDTDRLGEIVTNLLITDLSESKYLNVVSSQRLYDILKLLGKEGLKSVDKSIASDVATRVGAKWMLLGSILQTQPDMVLTAQLVEVEGGAVVGSQRIAGAPGEKVFSLVDKLSAEVKKDLSLPAAASREPDRTVTEFTTTSPEAYKYYLEGLAYADKQYWLETWASFKKALEFDSTMAMAYYGLAMWTFGPEKFEYAKQAMRYADHVDEKSRHYIRGLQENLAGNYDQSAADLKWIVERYPDEKEAYYLLGQHYYRNVPGGNREAVQYLNRAIEIDPLYKIAYNVLAYVYNDLGDFDKSIWAIDKYISLVPDEANPYDSRADLYAYNGRLDEAIESYKKALGKKPDFMVSRAKLGNMYVFKREYARAEECYRQLASDSEKSTRSWGRYLLAMIPAHQGKFEEALRVLDQGLAADEMERYQGNEYVGKIGSKVDIYYGQGKPDLALKEMELFIPAYARVAPEDIVGGRDYRAYLLARAGRQVEARQVAASIKKDIEKKYPETRQDRMSGYWFTMGLLELGAGDPSAAVGHFENAVKAGITMSSSFGYRLGSAYLGAGRLGEAVEVLEKAARRYDWERLYSIPDGVLVEYQLAKAYDKSGWTTKAIQAYEEFLLIWKDADPGIPEVDDARRRVAELKGQT